MVLNENNVIPRMVFVVVWCDKWNLLCSPSTPYGNFSPWMGLKICYIWSISTDQSANIMSHLERRTRPCPFVAFLRKNRLLPSKQQSNAVEWVSTWPKSWGTEGLLWLSHLGCWLRFSLLNPEVLTQVTQTRAFDFGEESEPKETGLRV